MAGVSRANGGNSGRPVAGTGPRFEPSTPAPELRASFESIDECLAWTYRELAAGRIPSREADVLIGAAGRMTTRLRASFAEREVEELRALVARQETAIATLTNHERRDRYESPDPARPKGLGRVKT